MHTTRARLMAVVGLALCAAAGSAGCREGRTAADAGPLPDAAGVDGDLDAGAEPDATPGDSGAADAGVVACATVGETRTAICGNCGLRSQRCSASNVWEDESPCLDEGECPAATYEHDTSRCGDRERICDDACTWRTWTVTTPQGDCDAGETRTPTGITCALSEEAVSVCTTECVWADSCRSTCDSGPAASRTGATPICIPSGPFLLGSSTSVDTSPERSITLSTYHIDRDMVTAGRYRSCVADGACTAPPSAEPFGVLPDEAIAVTLPYESAEAFCLWDGGDLPTEYQWEKAARGPAPDPRLLPYSGASVCNDTYFCSGMLVVAPGGTVLMRQGTLALLTSALPGSHSPWGVHQLGAAVHEYTRTLYKSAYADVAAVDPGDQPGAGPRRTIRGWSGYLSVLYSGIWTVSGGPPGTSVVSRTADRLSGAAGNLVGFRCVY